METLTKLIEKLSSYQILNYLIPGSVFCVLLKHLVGYDIVHFFYGRECYYMLFRWNGEQPTRFADFVSNFKEDKIY